MGTSPEHKQLQHRGAIYLLNKSYWICGEEVPMPVGICDVWGMQRHGEGLTMAIEVKVSRADFRSRSQRYKETSSFILGNQQYILCPKDLILPEELHPEWGLLWWDGERMVNKKKAPPLQMTAQQKLDVLLYFLHNGANAKRPTFSPPELQEAFLQESLFSASRTDE